MKHKAGWKDYLVIILLGLFAIGLILPQGGTAGLLLVASTLFLGLLGAVQLIETGGMISDKFHHRIYRFFVILSAFGLAFVIFIGFVIASVSLWFYKNPIELDNIQCG